MATSPIGSCPSISAASPTAIASTRSSWPAAHPRILGALLDLAVAVARTLPDIALATRPRTADFARIVAAVDQVLGTNG